MKVIFLDIDGVLNNARKPLLKLDPENVARLNALCRRSGARVVVSSSWRLWGMKLVRARLLEAGFVGPIVGRTPIPKALYVHGQRGMEVQAWLDRTQRTVERFIILDDHEDMGHLEPRTVRTDGAWGLTDQDVERALTLLIDTG